MGVYIPYTSYDYTQMQGPAPSGFHVPLNIEWKAIKTVWTTLGGGSSDGTNFGIALKLPFAGRRNNSSAGVDYQGSYGNYWSSSRYSEKYADSLYFLSTSISAQSSNNRACGFSVRCFKNSPTIPTSSWTKLYGTSIESGGIFWSSADGLISLSSDGSNWITIMDKNLGATQVWNSGDTLSEANCGKYYQRGNNYGFPRTGTIANQSTTQVDASNYGPGNYYSSDTFIKKGGRWDTTDNGNLRGGVTGVNPMSELKNAYIGEYRVPGANTVAYYPLNGDINDHSSNGYNLSGSISYETVNNIKVAKFSGSNYLTAGQQVVTETKTLTISFWIELNTSSSEQAIVCNAQSPSYKDNGINITKFPNGYDLYALYGHNVTGWMYCNPITLSSGTWVHYVSVFNRTDGTIKAYKNGVLINSGTAGYDLTYTGVALTIGGSAVWNRYFDGRLSNVIIENKVRTAQEISNYYNLTKSNYGL